jgi:hypothetical protein
MKDLMFWKKKDEDLGASPLDNAGFSPEQGFGPTPGTEPFPTGVPGEEGFGAEPQVQTRFELPGQVPAEEEPAIKPRLRPETLEIRPEYTIPKEYELIAAKLDTIKVSLEMVNQRLENIERSLKEKKSGW